MYTTGVELTYSAVKNRLNKRNHGVYLSRAKNMDWNSALYALDDREDYGEQRWIATGFLDARLYVLIFTETATGIRAISLRKAEKEEAKIYAEG